MTDFDMCRGFADGQYFQPNLQQFPQMQQNLMQMQQAISFSHSFPQNMQGTTPQFNYNK